MTERAGERFHCRVLLQASKSRLPSARPLVESVSSSTSLQPTPRPWQLSWRKSHRLSSAALRT